MRATVFNAPGHVTVEERPTPFAGPGEVRLRVGAASLCASDVRVYRGEKYALAGVIPGHEISGVIDQLGEGVEASTNLREGDRVILCPIVACNACRYCLLGRRNRCVKRETLGYDLDGGFAEYLRVPAALVETGHVIKIPDALPLDLAAITEPSACTLASLELCEVGAGTSMAILGAGPMGLMHLLLGRALGAGPIIVSEPVAERRALAARWGADIVLDPETDDVRGAVMSATGEGADAVIVSVGMNALVGPALSLVRPQGVVNLFAGFPKGGDPVPFDPNLVHYGEVILTGSQNATTDQYRRTVQLIGHVPHYDELLTNRYTVEQGPEAYESRLALAGLKSLIQFAGVDER